MYKFILKNMNLILYFISYFILYTVKNIMKLNVFLHKLNLIS